MIVRHGAYFRAKLMLRTFGPLLVAEPIPPAVLSLRTLWTFKTFGNDVMVLHSSTDGEMTAVTAG